MIGWSVCSPRGSARNLWPRRLFGCRLSVVAGRVGAMAISTPSPGLAASGATCPREGRLLLSIVVIEFLGTGLVLPFHVVYLHEVRGFALSDVGLLLGVPPLMGLLVVGSGRLGDRPDRRPADPARGAVLLVVGDVSAGVRDHATGRRRWPCAINGIAFGMIVAGLAEPDRDGDPPRAAPALLRGELHPAQPRHRDRRHHRRLLRRRLRRAHLPDDLPRRRRSPTSPRCCSCSSRCGTWPAGSRSPTSDAAAPMGYLAVLRSPAMATLMC